jgi:hypothetical protein
VLPSPAVDRYRQGSVEIAKGTGVGITSLPEKLQGSRNKNIFIQRAGGTNTMQLRVTPSWIVMQSGDSLGSRCSNSFPQE